MSEYQYYEFQALDRPLTKNEMAELRAVSTRAKITPTLFVNSYNWGGLKADPPTWMEKYFDAFLYVANWGSHDLALRLPRSQLDLEVASRYCVSPAASARQTGDFVILEFCSEAEEVDDWEDDGSGWLSSLVPLRADLARGDLRALYLAWLHCLQSGDVKDGAREPPVPAGLGALTAPLEALRKFLRIDRNLLDEAAVRSPHPQTPSRKDLEQWLATLPEAEKATILLRLMTGEGPQLTTELLRRFDQEGRREKDEPPEAPRTAAELIAAAAQRAEERRRREAERQARERARREREEAAALDKRMEELAKREAQAWRQVDALIATTRPAEYDQAVTLLVDLRELGARRGRAAEVQQRIAVIRQVHARKPSFIQRMQKAGLT